MSHTSVPWKFNEDGNEIENEDNEFVAYVNGITGLRIEDANFIIKVSNAHYELLEALKAVEANIEETDSCMGDFAIMVNKIKAAIAKAEGK